jgi:tetratricopeptide (TPR) repeat protein/predicted GH43/DUF377 family glycosyl hydrolase
MSRFLQKLLTDAALLERRLKADPDDRNSAFNLAQCYANLGMPEEAIAWYEKRMKMGGGDEEVWYSLYRLGVLRERTEDPQAVDTLVQAYTLRPNRAEPLAALARLFLRKRQWGMAALHASAAMVMTPPPDDRLFIERNAYGEKIREVYVAASINLGRKVTSLDTAQTHGVKPIVPTPGLKTKRVAVDAQASGPQATVAHSTVSHAGDALLGLVMVVKNEVHGILKTLLSVRPYIDYWTILDTGSTDGTQGEICKALEGIPGQLHEEPFIDFATTYNRAFELHGRATSFVLHLLGDEELVGGDELRDFVVRDPAGAVFYTTIQQGEDRYKLPRLSRSGSGWRYSGRTHEAFGKPGFFPDGEVQGVVIVRGTAPDETERKHNRWELDRDILEEDLQKNPRDARTVFYLAQTYAALGDAAKAVELYQMRIDLGGWSDEVYESKFRLARCLTALGRPWADVQQAYLDAHAFDPRRAEPLFAIAEHWYAQENHVLAYLFAQRANDIPLPDVALFVKSQVYDNLAANIVGTSAFYVAERTGSTDVLQKGMRAAEKCIAAQPWDEQLRDNRAHYCRFAEDLWSFQAKRLDFKPPAPFSPMNPSVAYINDRWLCVIRTANYRFLPGGGYEVLGDDVQTRNFMAELSPTFDIVRATEMIDKAERPRTDFYIHGYEDCRLFWWNGALRVTATACDLTKNGDREIVLCTLDDDYAIVEAKALRGQWSTYPQKNWMPVVSGLWSSNLRFVYSTFPEVVLPCKPHHDTENDFVIGLPQNPNFAPQRLRGGSQGVRVADGWLFLVHDVAWAIHSRMPPRTYLHRFVLMDEDLRVVRMSDPFFFIKKGIEFGAGMALKDEQLVVSFGVDDAQAYLGVFYLPEVLASLRSDYVI